jgi:hypothetical protein
MTFIHPLLLAGLVLVGIPVLIHLIMQQKPKRLLFPAFRFLQQRLRTNQRKLRLRHLLLLLLRMALIAAICLALARPRIFSQYSSLLNEDSPAAVVLLFDTSYSMEYKVAERSRLDDAKRRALELLDELPENSRVAVLDSADLGGEWITALPQARDQVNRLQLRHANAPVTRQLVQAYRLFDKLAEDQGDGTEAAPRFLYVFSDRTPESWDERDVQGLPPAPTTSISAVFVDVGVDNAADLAITDLKLARQAIGPEDKLEVQATVRATGSDADTFVTFSIDGETPGEQQPVQVPAGSQRTVTFKRPVGELAAGPHRVEVRLANSDSLPFDDARFATFEVRAGRKVLALADNRPDARIWRLALDTGRNFTCAFQPAKEAESLDPQALLTLYKAVCLIDVAEPGRGLWDMLGRYVQKGGNLVIVPGGDELKRDAYGSEQARQLLPAKFKQPVEAKEPGVPWVQDAPPHLLLAPFQSWRKNVDVDFFRPEYLPRAVRYWEVEPADGADVITTYADDAKRPALVERTVGEGRVLLFTTGFDGRRTKGESQKAWWNNYLESSFYFVLVNEAVSYLAGDREEPHLNYLAGEAATVSLPPASRSPLYTLQGPGLGAAEASVPRAEDQKQLQIAKAVVPGSYTVLDNEGHVIAGFSVNDRPEECLLTRDPERVQKIEAVLGPGSVLAVGHTASLRDALQRHWRQPVELLPWLMIALLLVLAFENLLANKFYRRPAGEK